MQATAVQDRNLIVVSDYNQVDFSRHCIRWLAIFQLAPRRNLDLFAHMNLPTIRKPQVAGASFLAVTIMFAKIRGKSETLHPGADVQRIGN